MKQFIKNLEGMSTLGQVARIRPKVLIKELEDISSEPLEMKICMPPTEIGCPSVFEATMLICLLKLLNPKKIFEFGTFLGYSTHTLLSNSSDDCKLYSIDLGDDVTEKNIDKSCILKDGKINDDYLRTVQSKLGPTYLKNYINDTRLNLIYGDSISMSVDDLELNGQVELVFIDGGHSYEIIKSDSDNALKMVKNGVIIWHDYNSRIHFDVTKYVNEICRERKIFHIENTMLAFQII